MVRSPCPIHDVTHFGVTHYAMHPALSTNTNCTCNFMPKGAKRAKRAKRAVRSTLENDPSAAAAAPHDPRLAAILYGLDCNTDFGWGKIMGYATAAECEIMVDNTVEEGLNACF